MGQVIGMYLAVVELNKLAVERTIQLVLSGFFKS